MAAGGDGTVGLCCATSVSRSSLGPQKRTLHRRGHGGREASTCPRLRCKERLRPGPCWSPTSNKLPGCLGGRQPVSETGFQDPTGFGDT